MIIITKLTVKEKKKGEAQEFFFFFNFFSSDEYLGYYFETSCLKMNQFSNPPIMLFEKMNIIMDSAIFKLYKACGQIGLMFCKRGQII